MNPKLLVPLCAAAALLVACGRTDTQATSEDTGSTVEMIPETDAATSTTESVPGTTSTPATPATQSDDMASDMSGDTATTPPPSDAPPATPPPGE